MLNPLDLRIGVTDDAKAAPGAIPPRTPPVTITWSKFRGPGEVTFSKPGIDDGKATAAATFREPGDYVLLVVANDWSGDGGRGFQCCWTTAQVKVSVQGGR